MEKSKGLENDDDDLLFDKFWLCLMRFLQIHGVYSWLAPGFLDNPSHNLNRCIGQLMDYLEVCEESKSNGGWPTNCGSIFQFRLPPTMMMTTTTLSAQSMNEENDRHVLKVGRLKGGTLFQLFSTRIFENKREQTMCKKLVFLTFQPPGRFQALLNSYSWGRKHQIRMWNSSVLYFYCRTGRVNLKSHWQPRKHVTVPLNIQLVFKLTDTIILGYRLNTAFRNFPYRTPSRLQVCTKRAKKNC